MKESGPIYDSISQWVGATPMVRLSRVGRDLPVELLGKCEFLNPGGSVKDRIGVRMIEDAEAEGRIKPGDTLIEPTSGNTGIGMAMAAAAKGYRMIITMPEKMSQEKQVVLEALGAEIIRTPTEAAFDAPDSHISVARRLQEVLPKAHILDQYSNLSNPLAHEEGTGKEIIEQCEGRLDAVVISAGTGGTITGVARAIKNELPHVQIVGVDPEGSILAGPAPVRSYKVEGIGYDFIPDVLDRDLVDRWIKSNDEDSFRRARQLIRQEGLLVGGSSGAALCGAIEVAREMKEGQRVVVILPDSVRNYLTKFVHDPWLRQHGLMQSGWETNTVEEFLRALPAQELISVAVQEAFETAVRRFGEHGISQLPVLDDGKLVGIITETEVLQALMDGRATADTAVVEVMNRKVATVDGRTELSELSSTLEDGRVAVVMQNEQVRRLVTRADLIDYLSRRRAGVDLPS